MEEHEVKLTQHFETHSNELRKCKSISLSVETVRSTNTYISCHSTIVRRRFSLVLTNPPVTCQITWHLHYATMNRTAVWALPVLLWRLQISWQQQCNAQLTRTWLWIRDSFTAYRSGTSSGNSSGCFVGVSSPLGGSDSLSTPRRAWLIVGSRTRKRFPPIRGYTWEVRCLYYLSLLN